MLLSVPLVVLVGLSTALRYAERQAITPVDPEMVDALQTVSFLAPLPLPTAASP